MGNWRVAQSLILGSAITTRWLKISGLDQCVGALLEGKVSVMKRRIRDP